MKSQRFLGETRKEKLPIPSEAYSKPIGGGVLERVKKQSEARHSKEGAAT
jgi:hypothetical protein